MSISYIDSMQAVVLFIRQREWSHIQKEALEDKMADLRHFQIW